MPNVHNTQQGCWNRAVAVDRPAAGVRYACMQMSLYCLLRLVIKCVKQVSLGHALTLNEKAEAFEVRGTVAFRVSRMPGRS